VKHDLAILHATRQVSRIQQVALDEAETLVLSRFLQKSDLAGRKIIVAGDIVSESQETVGQVAADKAGASGYEAAQTGFPGMVGIVCKESIYHPGLR